MSIRNVLRIEKKKKVSADTNITDAYKVPYGQSNVGSALDEVNADTVRLWQNSEIDSQGNLTYFSSQKISIPTLQNYKYIKIVHSNYAKKNQQIQTFINKSAYSGLLFNTTGLNQANYYVYVQSRLFTIENDGITFGDGISSNVSSSVTQNAYCIPLEIWGCNKP